VPSPGRVALLIIGLGVGGALAAWADGAPPPPGVHAVEIRGFAFVPDTLVVRRGDTVVWRNRDAVPHTATSEGGEWGSPELGKDGAWRVVVETGGAYRCALHPTMRGVIVVR
jgi:plastocyanin